MATPRSASANTAATTAIEAPTRFRGQRRSSADSGGGGEPAVSVSERILLVSSLYPPKVIGGAEIVVRNLAEGLQAQGHEVCVATLAPHGHAANRVTGGIAVKELELRYRYWPFSGAKAGLPGRFFWHVADNFDPTFYHRLRALIREFAPTIVNTHNINGFTPAVWLGTRHASNAPIVHTLHDYALLCSRTTMFARGRTCEPCCTSCQVLTWGKRCQTRLVNGVVGVSRAVLEPHLEGRLFARSCAREVIYNGRSPNRPPPRVPGTNGALRLGFMGRLSVEKGIALLYEELARVGGEIVLQVAGRGDDQLVDRLAVEHGVRTNRVGFIAPEAFYEQVDVLIVPSLWREPLATVVLEALGYGVPVIVSNRGGLPELVQEGETASSSIPPSRARSPRSSAGCGMIGALCKRSGPGPGPPRTDSRSSGWCGTICASTTKSARAGDRWQERSRHPEPGAIRNGVRVQMRSSWPILVALVLGQIAVPAAAFEARDLQHLRDTGSCQGCDLAGVEMRGADLREALLAGADLTGVLLENANLFAAELAGAKLERAVLVRVDLDRARLRGASLAGADLADASLDWADLAGADLSGATLAGGSLFKARLTAANMVDTRAQGANLFQAELRGADLSRADLRQASLAGANLTGATLAGADLQDIDLAGADLTGAVFAPVAFSLATDPTGLRGLATVRVPMGGDLSALERLRDRLREIELVELEREAMTALTHHRGCRSPDC